MEISVYDVFPQTEFPFYTYVSRSEYEETLKRILKSKIIAFVYGASRTGKTTLAKKVVGDSLVIGCDNFESQEIFWKEVAKKNRNSRFRNGRS